MSSLLYVLVVAVAFRSSLFFDVPYHAVGALAENRRIQFSASQLGIGEITERQEHKLSHNSLQKYKLSNYIFVSVVVPPRLQKVGWDVSRENTHVTRVRME